MDEQLSSQNWPAEKHIIDRMQASIDAALGKGAWAEITGDNPPRAGMDHRGLSAATSVLVARFDELADGATAYRVFSSVRHGLSRADFQWARERFLQYNDIDRFAQAMHEDSTRELEGHLRRGTLFYGQPITAEVMDYLRSVDDLFYGKRSGNNIYATAIPYRAKEYLRANDERTKRYCMCHCQFARESILGDAPVSRTMCNCSLGHNLMLWEAALGTELEGVVAASALAGDDTCKFVITLPDMIMDTFVHTP